MEALTDEKVWRWRALHRLIGTGGACDLIYDLERTEIIEVPHRFRHQVAGTLAPGVLNEGVLGWFKSEGLLTAEPRKNWAQGTPAQVPTVTDVSLDMSGACNMGCAYCFENEIGSRIGRMSVETALASLEFAFEKSRSSQHLSLHFGSGEPLLRFDLLQTIVH